MTKDELQAFLAEVPKDELIKLYVEQLEEKKIIESDLQTIGNSFIPILKNLGVMDENNMILATQGTMINAGTKVLQNMMTGRMNSFSSLKVLPPILIKYKHLFDNGK